MNPIDLPARTMPGATPGRARLGVVLVNYKRADDTIECLESLARSTIPLRVVVVDNASGDGSLDTIAEWAAGRHLPPPPSPAMAGFSQPPLPKPLAVAPVRMTAEQAVTINPASALALVDAGANGGFAAGNNIGLRHLLRDPGIDHVWLLNNDTVVDPAAAAALLTRLDATPGVGMCGTVVRYYWQPDTVQALNGLRFDMLTGSSKCIGGGTPASAPFNPGRVAAETDFIIGASLAVSRQFVATVGLMSEAYFLYFEEIDWAMRNDGRFKTTFAQGAIVYHKEGGSIGSSAIAGARSTLSDYWMTRSRLRFIARFRPLLLPWHAVLTVFLALRRLLRRQPRKAAAIVRALFGVKY